MRSIFLVIGCSLLTTSILSAAFARLAHQMAGPPFESRNQAAPSPPPFSDLESAIAAQGWAKDWKVYRGPEIPGPYRVVGLTFTIGPNVDESTIVSHLDKTGRFVAPLELRGNPDFAQMAVHLETPDGRITGVVLKR